MWYTFCMKIKLSPAQVQKLILAPVIQQSIGVLLLPIAELNMVIEQELQNNPLLEVDEDTPDSFQNSWDAEVRQRIEKIYDIPNLPYDEEYSNDETFEERPITREVSLEDQLIQQLHIELSDPLQREIGELIIGDIDEDGYLKTNIDEICKNAGVDDKELVEHILKVIQDFAPKGIASRDLKECLLIQAKNRVNGQNDLVDRIIAECLPELGQKKYSEIAKKLGSLVEEVKNAVKIISSLDPRPARNFRPIGANIYIKPDIFITKDPDHGYQIHVNQEGIHSLRINPLYQRLLQQNNLREHEKEFIREKLKNAIQFIKSVEQRGQTLREIAKFILDKQKPFFKSGPSALIPMTLKDVAVAINRNESTISRAINNKYLDSPQGLYPIKFLFSQGVSTENKDGIVSNRCIKEEIKNLIDAEKKSSPLSDQDIQTHFEQKGMKIARRTISKYRQKLKIYPSYLRKQ